MRLLLFFILISLTLTAVSHVSDSKKTTHESPNIVIFLCDDLGYGDLGSFGHPIIQTPNLDRLAQEGMRLEACYSAAPVCSPSRVGLLTGISPNKLAVYDWIPNDHPMHMPDDAVTLADWLQKVDYQTALFGKWHCNGKFNSALQPQPDDHGFDYWFATQNNASPSHKNPRNFVRNGKNVGMMEGYSCQLVVDEAINWLRQNRNLEQAFFHFITFHEPHEPIASPSDFVEQYLPQTKNEDEAQYFANVANMDNAVGRYLQALEEIGLSENTLVIFTSDNGPETLNRYKSANRSYGSPGRLRGMKLHVYDGGIRVPGIIRWKGTIEPNQIIKTPISSLDFFPTACALANVSQPETDLEGTSLLPLFAGKELERYQPLFWYYFRAMGKPHVAIRDGEWKLLAETEPDNGPGGRMVQKDIELYQTMRPKTFEMYQISTEISEAINRIEVVDTTVLNRMKNNLRARLQAMQRLKPHWQVEQRKE